MSGIVARVPELRLPPCLFESTAPCGPHRPPVDPPPRGAPATPATRSAWTTSRSFAGDTARAAAGSCGTSRWGSPAATRAACCGVRTRMKAPSSASCSELPYLPHIFDELSSSHPRQRRPEPSSPQAFDPSRVTARLHPLFDCDEVVARRRALTRGPPRPRAADRTAHLRRARTPRGPERFRHASPWPVAGRVERIEKQRAPSAVRTPPMAATRRGRRGRSDRPADGPITPIPPAAPRPAPGRSV